MNDAHNDLRHLSLAEINELRNRSVARKKRTQIPPLVPQERGKSLPLSFAQERLWYIDQLGLVGAAYNAVMLTRLEGKLKVKALERSFSEVLRRHEILRTRFDVVAGQPNQVIDPPMPFELPIVDLSALQKEQRTRALHQASADEARRPFDLATGPLIRVLALKLSEHEHVLLMAFHHIVTDGWSWRVLYEELSTLYSTYVGGRPSPLPELPVQYADYAIWQRRWLRGSVLDEQLSYWRRQLLGAPSQLQLPTDRPRPVVESFRGAMHRFKLPASLTAALSELARLQGATQFMVFLAAFHVLLSRWSGQESVVVGVPIAGRRAAELERLIGFFINTLALRADVSKELSFRQLLDRMREMTLEAYENQDLPFEILVKELHPERNLTRQPLFQAMLEVENYGEQRLETPELTWAWSWTTVERASTHFDLTLYLHESEGGVSGAFEYATDLFDPSTIDRMARSFQTLLEGIVENSDRRVGQLPLLSDVERQKLRGEWSTTLAPYVAKRCVHEFFEEQVKLVSERTAVLHEGQSLTYEELNCKANQLARYLVRKGIGPDQLVAICIERSVEMVVGLLGILKAGAAYIPLDPNYPIERLQYMLEDAAPEVVLVQAKLKSTLPITRAEMIALDERWDEIAGYADSDLSPAELEVSASSLVYVIYTSGSTGRPKGTTMTHRSMGNLIEWHRRTYRAQPGQRVLQFAALSFDVAFQEIFSTLCTGGTLVLLNDEVRRDARALAELLRSQSIERLFVPPLMLQSLAEHCQATDIVPESLRDVITAGEQLRISPEISSFFKRLQGCRLHNHYGPTETHVVTALSLPEDAGEWPSLPSIGQPISNTQIYILDRQRQLAPIGVTGEIYIGGANVARGYLRRPALTAERFIADPFNEEPPSRMYQTGDLGRWRTDGSIEYLGRNDAQVKIRGFRVELAEIEAQLLRHSRVREAAALVREDSPGEKRLVAYVSPRANSSLNVEELRAHLQATLPDYMVPSAFVILQSFPLTPSGKLDRRALPAPQVEAYASEEYEAPQGEIEQTLARIWQELLQLERVGRQDNFFELGGHSLLAVKTLFRINQSCRSTLKLTDLYTSPTVRQLAAQIQEGEMQVEFVDLRRESELDEGIVAIEGTRSIPPQALMLTGATGFVGRFLLAQLLLDTAATVYCVVRASSPKEAMIRVRTILEKWDLWQEQFALRLVAIPGDLRLPRLGIDEVTYQLLSQKIDSIYHCGTSMNHLETYAMAKPANVDSAREILKLATNGRPKLINFISALGVFRGGSAKSRVVDELSPIENEIHAASNGYAASKWVAEKIFMIANQRGIPCNIFRLGFIWADRQRGRYDELQRGYRILKSSFLCGCGIRNYRHISPATPVDYAARAVLALAERHPDGSGIFHVSSPSERIEGLFERCNAIAGTSLKLLSYYEWIQEIKRLHGQGQSLPIVPLVEFAFAMDERSLIEHERRVQSEFVRFDCTRTYRELAQAGILEHPLDDDWLSLCVRDMFARDLELSRLKGAQWSSHRVREGRSEVG